jgi:cytochrome b subunit of formate dehydrogenase
MRHPGFAFGVAILALVSLLLAPVARAQDAPSRRAPATPESPSVIPHDIAGRAACAGCHGLAGKNPYPHDHLEIPSTQCLRCHVPSRLSKPRAPDTPVPPSVTNDYCFACHEKAAIKMALPSGETLDLHVDREAYAKSIHGRKNMSCTACHPTAEKHPHAKLTGTSAREINRSAIQKGCAACHAEIYAQYEKSVHGKALIQDSNLDVPGCADCHGIHDIRDPKSLLFRVDSPDTCSTCHADTKLMGKYGISASVTKTYLAEFHGKTVDATKKIKPGFAVYEAVCYDCHGIHDIKKADDPNSAVIQANLTETCRRCHPGAQANFPASWMGHYEPDRKNKWAVVYWVTLFYKLLIPGAIAGMLGFIGLDLFRTVVDKIKARKAPKEQHAPEPQRMFTRFSFSQRMEHLVEIVSFTTLVVTGLPQFFAAYAPARWLLGAMGGLDVVRGIHRTFGFVMVLQAVYHVGALAGAAIRGRFGVKMIPGIQDVKDVLQLVFYQLGIKKERPRFDRYDFKQKMEYVLLIWGSLVMTITGLMLWFPVIVTRYVPGEFVAAARAAHIGEALLAAFSITVWHMYFAHLNAEVFPFDLSMFTGKISEERMRHEHPLELERILAAEQAAEAPKLPEPDAGSHPVHASWRRARRCVR